MTLYCPVCYKRIRSHAYQTKCVVCCSVHHMKCISLTPNDHEYLREHRNDWYCKPCISCVFPFNSIDDDNEYAAAINYIDKPFSFDNSDLIFHSFEMNDTDRNSPLCEIDPELCFYNSIDFDLSHFDYNDEAGFIQIINKMNTSNQLFSLCHFNIRSMKHNSSQFEIYLKSLEFNFYNIALSETLLRDDTRELYRLNGYVHFEKHRTCRQGCGVGLFVRHSIPFIQRTDLCYLDEFIDCVTIEIEKGVFNTPRNIIVSSIYRLPNTDTIYFIEAIDTILDITKREQDLLLLGDYNENILNYQSHSSTAQCVDLLYSHATLPLINRPTRIYQNSATLIDNIFTNNINTIEKDQQGIVVTDNIPVFYVNSCHKQLITNDLYICRWNYCYDNKLVFQQALSEADWSGLYMQWDDVQRAFALFHSRYVDLFDKHFPKRKIKLTQSNRKPWLISALKQSICKKNRLYPKFERIQYSYNECHYKCIGINSVPCWQMPRKLTMQTC